MKIILEKFRLKQIFLLYFCLSLQYSIVLNYKDFTTKTINMETIKVIIERNDNGNFQAVPQMNESIAFFGMGKTVAEAISITGINRKQLNHYVTGYRKPSPKIVQRIQDGIRKYAEELSHIVLI